MTTGSVQFPEYGMGGDDAGARRSRRAFMLCVTAVLLFMVGLWFAEEFLQYEHTERLYRSALTLPILSARPMLQAAIKEDALDHEFPSPKYIEALASREDRDSTLQTYERAYQLDPTNSAVAIRYGCRLLAQGQLAEARERFREAAENGPTNALPLYLEATAQTWSIDDRTNLKKSLAMVARTNNRGEKITFPEPLWFPGLPQDGYWYGFLRRRILDECLGPLYGYTDRVIQSVDEELERGRIHYLQTWLKELRVMGERLVSSSEEGGTGQAVAGMHIQLMALEKEIAVARARSDKNVESLEVRQARLFEAVEVLQKFEERREAQIVEGIKGYYFPLALIFRGFAVCLFVYSLMWMVCRGINRKGTVWSLAHFRGGMMGLLGGVFVLFLLLAACAVLQRSEISTSTWTVNISYAWWIVLGGLCVFGVIYPGLFLASATSITQIHVRPEEQREMLAVARRYRLMAYVSLSRRYYGILCGAFLCMSSGWVVLYRVVFAQYPWQKELLTSGLFEEEVAVIRMAVSMLF